MLKELEVSLFPAKEQVENYGKSIYYVLPPRQLQHVQGCIT
jgi:hypothetical protein